MDYAVVIPAFNEAATIADVVRRALAQTPTVIVVDDGSSDATATQLAGLPITLLQNGVNCGKAASLWRGMQHALAQGVDAIVTLDADGQHAPEDIPRLLQVARTHWNFIVIGARCGDVRTMPKMRYYANRIANFWISWACGYRVRDSQSGFRLYPARLLARLQVAHDKQHGFVFESETLIEAARLGFDSVAVAIPAVYRRGARASYYRQIDSARITRMVAGKLISRWLYPQGFYRAFLCEDTSPVDVE